MRLRRQMAQGELRLQKLQVISESVYEQIRQALISPEMGGILGTDDSGIVTNFYHDTGGISTKKNYIPDVKNLNEVIDAWSKRGIKFVGFVHSHSKNKSKLSAADIDYAEKIKSTCHLTEILMLLYLPATKTFYQYII